MRRLNRLSKPRPRTTSDDAPRAAKADPGDRARHQLTPHEAKELARYARKALKLKGAKRPRRGEKGKFADLEAESGMCHETLLKWALVADAFKGDLKQLLMELGKTRLYVLAYHPDPKAALDEEVVDRQGRTMTGRTVDAESLRLHIRKKYPEKRRGNWFRRHDERSQPIEVAPERREVAWRRRQEDQAPAPAKGSPAHGI